MVHRSSWSASLFETFLTSGNSLSYSCSAKDKLACSENAQKWLNKPLVFCHHAIKRDWMPIGKKRETFNDRL